MIDDNHCEASGRCFCIIKTERDEDTMPALIFGPEYSRTDAENELRWRQELNDEDDGYLPKQCIVTTCKATVVYWNGPDNDPNA